MLSGMKGLQIALISTDYPPLRTSAAVQMRDLAQEFLRQGYDPVVIIPSVDDATWVAEIEDKIKVLRLYGARTRGSGYLRRSIAEFLLPFFMLRALHASPYRETKWDLVIWYSPTIFFGPLIWSLKRRSNCKTYLILRDIFPEWAKDLGLIGKGPIFWFFKAIANFQYEMADTIGVQTPSNLTYLAGGSKVTSQRLEVLQNWQSPLPNIGSSISIPTTPLAGRKIFVYVGNMGVAQGMDILIDLAESLKYRQDLGFLFVGRGSEFERLLAAALTRSLNNTLFCNEVDSREMPGLLAQCHVGMLALDPRHKTHNIPGKFLTYLLAGLPVLARVNAGTDLAHLIEKEDVGRVYVGDHVDPLREFAEELADSHYTHERMAAKGRNLGAHMFSPETAVRQIIAASGLSLNSLDRV
jgi:glycosyltransferase involved in cell wall biosynthesis